MPDIQVFEKDITSGTLPNPIVLVVVFPHCYDEMTTPYSQHNSRIYGKIQQSETEMTPHIPNIKVIYMEESNKVKLL